MKSAPSNISDATQSAILQPDVLIIIVNWNTKTFLSECLASLPDSSKGLNLQVAVVDNASEDGSTEMVRSQFPDIQLLAQTENIGFVRGNNEAFAVSNCQSRYVLLLNSDAALTHYSLARMVDFMDSSPEAAACGPLTLNSDKSLQPTWSRFPTLWFELLGKQDRRFLNSPFCPPKDIEEARDLYEPLETDWLGGSCLLIRRKAIQCDLNNILLDPAFAMYSEETDLCYRLKKAGWKVYFVPTAEVVHHGGRSSRKMAAQTLALMYQSKLLFFQRHYGTFSTLLLRVGLSLMASAKWSFCVLRGTAYTLQRDRQSTVLMTLRKGAHANRN